MIFIITISKHKPKPQKSYLLELAEHHLKSEHIVSNVIQCKHLNSQEHPTLQCTGNTESSFLVIKNQLSGFPGGTVVESLPANAGDTGSGPGLGGSHMPRSDGAREPQLLSLRVWSLCSATGEAAMVRGPRTAMRSGPHLPQLERALAQRRRPNTAKNK